MQQMYFAHKEFAAAWETSKSANFNNGKPYNLIELSQEEVSNMFRANHQAYLDASPRNEKLYELLRVFYETYIIPLMPAFESGDKRAIDEMLDFLEIDIPAFKLGYEKEYIYGKLKRLPLDERHRERLRQIALSQCASPYYRRELTDLSRLMIKVGDESLVQKLEKLSESTGEFVRKKALRMLNIILQGRKDLRKAGSLFNEADNKL